MFTCLSHAAAYNSGLDRCALAANTQSGDCLMKFAYFSHVWNRPEMAPSDRYDQLWRELALADELDFDYGFAVEHHFLPHESWMTSF